MNNTEIIKGRIAALRDVMKAEGVDALIVPQADPHGSEYVADHWQTRRYLSGFTGSAGPLVVSGDKAWVIADSRYWLQAAKQLEGTGIGVVEAGKPGAPNLEQLLAAELNAGDTAGVDGNLMSDADFASLSDSLAAAGVKLIATPDLADKVWPDRPALPQGEVFIHNLEYAGEAAQAKLAALCGNLAGAGADGVFVADLAEIAWLLNIRSTDVDFNPVVVSYLYVSDAMKVLFLDEAKLTDEVRAYLAYCGVTTAPYSVAENFLRNLPAGTRVAYNAKSLPRKLAEAIASPVPTGDLGVEVAKAMRNDVQIAGIRAAMERDGAALVKGFREIEARVAAGVPTTEIDVDTILTARRAEQPLFFSLSFETIAGYAEHGAIVHYSATPESASALRPESLLLVDSGSSFLDGTTDITRTIALGEPTPEMRRDYTAVLKGNIRLASAVFPAGTRGCQLDVLAREAMWRVGGHYLHGTGHGVGQFLNVHEGPQSIRMEYKDQALLLGMVTSDEPGIYRAGKYGIRLENLILTVPAFRDEDWGEFYRFETLTLYPFDRSLIDAAALNEEEKLWLNNYHAEVLRRLSPLLSDDERGWLAEKCLPIE